MADGGLAGPSAVDRRRRLLRQASASLPAGLQALALLAAAEPSAMLGDVVYNASVVLWRLLCGSWAPGKRPHIHAHTLTPLTRALAGCE